MKALALGMAVVLLAGTAMADEGRTYRDDELIPYGKYTRSRPGGSVQYDINVTYPLTVRKIDRTEERLKSIEKKLDRILEELKKK
jgi:hypothetical protein